MRRSSRYLSMALSLAVVLVLGYHLYASPVSRHVVAKSVEKAPDAVEPVKVRPVRISAVRLPSPPRPAAKPVAIPAPKPPPPMTPTREVKVVPLKPAPDGEAVKVAAFRPLKPVKPVARHVPNPVVDETPPSADAGTVAPDAATAMQGRVLLRMLEHGTGPVIEIAWPTDSGTRASLYRQFSDCFGLRVAVLGTDGLLYTADSPPGRPWPLNLDAFSGFMRQHDASASRQETQELRRIRDVHGRTARGAPVRIFPRQVDAALLGGLQRIVGDGYAAHRSIRARYTLSGGRVYVDGVVADGQDKPGRVDLSASAGRACRGAGA